jgi:hypothetical protein
VPDQHQVVDAGFARERGLEVTAQVGELAFDAGEDAAAGGHCIGIRIGRNRAEAAVTADHRGDALCEFEFHAGIAKERAVVVRVRVDESRGEARALAVDLARCVPGAADRGDTSAVDFDVCVERGAAAAVEHPHVANREVDHREPPNIVALQNSIMSARNASASSPWLPIFAPRRPYPALSAYTNVS